MSSWSMGYQTDLPQQYTYSAEQNLLRAKFIFNQKGLAFPELNSDDSDFYFCELGFGQGITLNINAAASVKQTKWYGTDFNPACLSYAQRLAKMGTLQLNLSDDSFADFAKRDDLPQFDFIALNDVWSFISEENQNFIVDFVGKHLKAGGVFFISYQVSPGAVPFEPVRNLMYNYENKVLPADLTVEQRLSGVKGFLQGLMHASPSVTTHYPLLFRTMEQVLNRDTATVANELCHENWNITHFSDLQAKLENIKLSYACSALGLDHVDHINLSQKQKDFLTKFHDADLFEDIRDFIVNRQYRYDFFVKGACKLSQSEQDNALLGTFVVLPMVASNFTYTIRGRLGDANLDKGLYGPVVNALSDNKPHAIAEVITAATTADASHSIAEYFEAIRILVLTNVINVAVPEESITDEIKQQCQALNISMVANCEFDQIPVLASPVVQGGIYVSQVDKLILKADILDIPEDQVQSYIVGELFAHKYVVREGHLVRSLAQDTGDANTNTDQEVKELTEYVANIQGKFVDCVLPVLRALLVI